MCVSHFQRHCGCLGSLLNNVGLSAFNRGPNHLVASLLCTCSPLAERGSLLWSRASVKLRRSPADTNTIQNAPPARLWWVRSLIKKRSGCSTFSTLVCVILSKVLTYLITLRTTSPFSAYPLSIYSCLSPWGWMLDSPWRNKLGVWSEQQIRNKLKVKLLAWMCPLHSPWDFPHFRHQTKSLCLAGTLFLPFHFAPYISKPWKWLK